MCAVRDSIVMAGTLSSAEFEALVRQNPVAFAAFLQSNVVAAAAGIHCGNEWLIGSPELPLMP